MGTNKHGLDRNIPAKVQRTVREACSFGCVICGSVPYVYDHLKVEYADAKEHDPDDIVVLCPTHHTMKTNRVLDVDSILLARNNRKSLDSDFRFIIPATKADFAVNWGSTEIRESHQILTIDEVPTLRFATSENPLEPIVLSGEFRDRKGDLICVIQDNELLSRARLHRRPTAYRVGRQLPSLNLPACPRLTSRSRFLRQGEVDERSH